MNQISIFEEFEYEQIRNNVKGKLNDMEKRNWGNKTKIWIVKTEAQNIKQKH